MKIVVMRIAKISTICGISSCVIMASAG